MAVKKGSKSWRPAEALSVRGKDPNYTYRWCDKDAANIDKKLAEGWTFAKEDHAVGGETLTTTTEYRELVLMKLPKEDAEARHQYFQELTDKQTMGLKQKLKQDAQHAEIHGRIIIE